MRPVYLNYLHSFRGFAIIMIVAIHCRNAFPWAEEGLAFKFFISTLNNSTILFVFIAGFLFQYLNKGRFKYKKYFIRKMEVVILPYILISLPFIIFKLSQGINEPWLPEKIADQPFLQALYMIFTGKHLGPLWFMPMIFVFYTISFILIRLDDPRFYKFFFPIIFIAGLWTFRFGYFSNTLHSFIYFFPIYLLGMMSAHYREFILRNGKAFLIPLSIIYVLGTLLHIMGYIEIPRLNSFESASTLPFFSFNFTKLKVSMLCIILLVIFYWLKDRKMPFLNQMANLSFGIYFLHTYFIIMFQKGVPRFLENFNFNTFSFLFFTVVIVIISYVGVYVVKKITGKYSRMIIGS